MRPLTAADRRRVFTALDQWASTDNVVALRARALITLAADTGLRVGECCALELEQLLVDVSDNRMRLQEAFYLRTRQAKRGSAGQVHISKRARAAVRAYILKARRAGWFSWPPKARTPLFLAHRGQAGRAGHGRLSVRSAQRTWHEVQARARLSTRYGFHSLRHDAASRLRHAGADVFTLATQFRWRNLNHAQRYVHHIDSHSKLSKLAKVAASL